MKNLFLYLIFALCPSMGAAVTYTYADHQQSLDMVTCGVPLVVDACVFTAPSQRITRALVASPSDRSVLNCAASEEALKSTRFVISSGNVVPGTNFSYQASFNDKCSSCAMQPATMVFSNRYSAVGSTHRMYCAHGRVGLSLEDLPAAARVTILRLAVYITNANTKPQPVLELPGTLHLGDINPEQTAKSTPIPVLINCDTCPDGWTTQGTIAWRLESSPDNPSAEKPGMIFMGAESAATEGTNVVTFGRFVTEVSDYGLRWPRTNSAPLAPGSYRWTLTMTLSIL